MLISKKIMATVVTVVLVLSVVGCTKKGITITDSLRQLANAKSFNSDMTINMKISSNEEAATDTIFKSKMSLIASPLLAKLEMKRTDNGAETENSEMYIREVNKLFTVYMQSMEGWIKQDFEKGFVEYALSQYDARVGFNNYMKAATKLKEAGKEEINATATTKYDGVIPASEVKKVMDATGGLDFIGLSELTNENYKGIGDVPISFWISEEGNFPIKYSIDLTSTVQKIVENDNADNTQKMNILKYEISTVCSDFDGLEVFALPVEVEQATVFSGGSEEQNGASHELESIEKIQVPETTE